METTADKTRRRGNGEGSLTRRKDGRWMARFYVTLPNGERKRQHIILKSRDAVMKRMREEMLMADRGMPMNHEQRTVADWLLYWSEEVDKKRSKDSTYAMHCNHIHKNIIPEIGSISLLKLSPRNVRDMLKSWNKRGVGVRSQQIARIVLSTALNDAMKQELIHRNVVSLVEPPKLTSTERKIWTHEETKIFLRSMEGHKYYGLFLILFHYGLRRGEALGLRWKDIDFDNNIIKVRQAAYFVNHTLMIGDLKTKASKRDLPLIPAVKQELLAEYERRNRPTELEMLYVTSLGNPVNAGSFLRMFKDAARRAGLKPITLHEIRHSVATLLKEAGVSPKDAQTILGHASIVTTLQIYTHSSHKEKEAAISSIANIYDI